MSAGFRPVKEIWGEHSSSFISHDELVYLLEIIATRVGTGSSSNNYGDVESVWIGDGKKFLDFIQSPDFDSSLLKELSGDYGYSGSTGDFESLQHNMKAMADEWRGMIGPNGELHFYID